MSAKIAKILISALVVVNILLFLLLKPSEEPADLEAAFLDVGQGDAALITVLGETQILIDGGPDDTVLTKLGEYMPADDRQIEAVILTHAHDDHLSGLVEVLKRYSVERIFETGAGDDTAIWREWQAAKEAEGAEEIKVDRPMTLALGPARLDFFYSLKDLNGQPSDDLNNASIVNRLTWGEHSFLFTGDLEEEGEEALLKNNVYLKSEVLKIGHHGSDTSSSENFLNAVNSEYAIISVGEGNKYKHPKKEVLGRLEKAGMEIWRTDQDGDAVFIVQDNALALNGTLF